MPVEQIVSLLDRWRHADGMFARGRVLTEAVRLLRELTPDERRTLARTLAERGAPELAEQFEGSFGGSMEADQVRAIADQLLSMDDEQLGALVEGLRDPDQRRRLATDAVDRAFAVDDGADAAAGRPTSPPPGAAEDDGPPPPPGAPVPSAPAEPVSELDAAAAAARDTREAQRARLQELAEADDELDLDALILGGDELGDGQLGGQPLGDIELGRTELGAAGLGGIALGSADLVEADLVAVELGPALAPDSPDDAAARQGQDRPDDHASRETEVTDAGAHHTATTPGHDPSGSAVLRDAPVPVVVGSGADAGRDLRAQAQDAVGDAERLRTELLTRLGAIDQALPRLQVLQQVPLDHLDTSGALQVLDAFPDGWQRRRAALRLTAAGALRDVAADDLVPRFARTGDATFVVGGLIDAGHLDVDTLDGLLPNATVTRLRHRQEH